MVIGVEEPILIKGIGEMLAKIDSGNSGYNVIHGEDFIIQGDIITFKTFDKNGTERRVSKKIKETLNVNIGGGHIQERPVVELNVKFAGDDYKKVPFSITNRGDNEHQVLISKDFVGKELGALIDVTKDNISNNNVNVDYVTEGAPGAIATLKNKASNAVGTIAAGTKAGAADAAKWDNRWKSMWGIGGSPEERNKIDPKYDEEVKALGNLEEQMKKDAELIRKRIGDQTEKLHDLNAECKGENIAVFKILDYTGGTNEEQKNANPEYKARLEEALKAYKAYKSENNVTKLKKEEKNEAEERPLTEATTENSSQTPATPAPTAQNTANNPNTTPNTNVKNGETSPENEIQGEEGEKKIADMTEEEVEEVLKDLTSRNQAIFYIINFIKDNDDNELDIGKDMVGAIQTKINSWNTKIAQGKDWTAKAFSPAATDIANDVKDNSKGLFALCTNPSNSRNVEFFTEALFNGSPRTDDNDNNAELVKEYQELNNEYKQLGGEGDISLENLEMLINNSSSEPTNSTDELMKEYQELNNEYKQIADDLGQPSDSINLDDLQALIELANEDSQHKRADELGQTDQGDSHDSSYSGYHIENEGEERKV